MVATLCSALLFSLAYVFPQKMGLLVVIFWLPLYLKQRASALAPRRLVEGFLWGMVVYGIHFWWLYELLQAKSNATFFFVLLIYIVVVFCFALSSSLWFLISVLLQRFIAFTQSMALSLLTFFGVMASYFAFLHQYGLWFIGTVEGYPFLLPILPVAHHTWLVKLWCIIGMLLQGNLPSRNMLHRSHVVRQLTAIPNTIRGFHITDRPMPMWYLPPDTQATFLRNPQVVGQRIYQKLAALKLHRFAKEKKDLIVIAPEATFPFPLNEHQELLTLWNYVLPKNAHFLIGAYRSKAKQGAMQDKKVFQSFFWIKGGRVMSFYDKSHTVYFTEKVPKFWKKKKWAQNLFLLGKYPVSKPKNTNDPTIFQPTKHVSFIPQVCSELFMNGKMVEHALQKQKLSHPLVCWITKDSWFADYFKKLLEQFVYLRAVELDVPILYVAYSKVLFIETNSSRDDA